MMTNVLLMGYQRACWTNIYNTDSRVWIVRLVSRSIVWNHEFLNHAARSSVMLPSSVQLASNEFCGVGWHASGASTRELVVSQYLVLLMDRCHNRWLGL